MYKSSILNCFTGDGGLKSVTALLCFFCSLFLFGFDSYGFVPSEKASLQASDKTSTSAIQGIVYTPEESAWLEQHPVIRVSNEFDWPPFDFVVSGTPQGYGIDLMELLSERSGISFEYINGYTWDELIEMFFLGQIDLVHSLSITPERQEKAFFSPPYYHSKNVLILRRDAADTNDLSELEGKIIALPKGWSSIEFFRTYYPAVHIIEVESSRQALEYVDQGKVYATVEQESIATYFIKKFGFHDLKLSKWIDNDELQKTSSMHFMVLKTQPILFSILTKALSTLKPEDKDRLEQKWFGREGRLIGSEDVGLTPAEKVFLEDKKTITYCISPDRMPFEAYQGSQVSGMTADFLELFAERLGASFTMVQTGSWTESLSKIKSGDCEILPMVNETPERDKIINFTSSYLNSSMAIITREGDGFISSLHDFSGKKIGMPEGGFAWDFVMRDYPAVSFVRFPDVRQCLLQLSSGEIDAALLSLPVATYHIRHMGLDDLKVAGHSGLQDILRVGVTKDAAQLHSIMSKVVRSLPMNEIDSVYRKWVSLTFEHRVDYSLLWKILALIGFLVALVLLWNWQLMKLNRKIARANRELEEKSKELELISITDSLTGLFNRRHIDRVLETEVNRQARYQRHLSAILIDIDNFKQVNDTYGHQAGDVVLIKFAEILQSAVRESDVAGRWGGEEFLVICPECDLDGALIMAENLRKKFADLSFPECGQQTASFGVGSLQPGESRDGLIMRVDNALYVAKKHGKDRVEKSV